MSASNNLCTTNCRENGGRLSHLQDGVHGGVEVLAQAGAQAAVRWVADQRPVIELCNAHVRLGQDHLDQVDGALEEGPLRVHLPQIRPLALHSAMRAPCLSPGTLCFPTGGSRGQMHEPGQLH